MSFSTPTPAEAKLAPTSNFCPVSSGLRYGNVGSHPFVSPANSNFSKLILTLEFNVICNFQFKGIMHANIYMENITDDIGNVEAVGEAASGTVRWVVDAIGRGVGPSGGDQVVVVAVIH